MRSFVEDYKYSYELMDLYEVSVKFESDYKAIDGHHESVGQWLEDNNNNYFSRVTYRREIADENLSDVAKNIARITLAYGGSNHKYKTVVSGFDITVDVPFKLIDINAHPKYPNLDWCGCKIAFVFSPANIRFFYFYLIAKLENWEYYSYDSSSGWKTIEVEMKDKEKLEESMSSILSGFDSFIMAPIVAKYM